MSSGKDSPPLEGQLPPPNARIALLEAEQAKWLTIQEAAFVLRTEQHTILKAIHQGHLELFAMGRVWRIHADSLARAQKTLADWAPVPVRRMA